MRHHRGGGDTMSCWRTSQQLRFQQRCSSAGARAYLGARSARSATASLFGNHISSLESQTTGRVNQTSGVREVARARRRDHVAQFGGRGRGVPVRRRAKPQYDAISFFFRDRRAPAPPAPPVCGCEARPRAGSPAIGHGTEETDFFAIDDKGSGDVSGRISIAGLCGECGRLDASPLLVLVVVHVLRRTSQRLLNRFRLLGRLIDHLVLVSPAPVIA